MPNENPRFTSSLSILIGNIVQVDLTGLVCAISHMTNTSQISSYATCTFNCKEYGLNQVGLEQISHMIA